MKFAIKRDKGSHLLMHNPWFYNLQDPMNFRTSCFATVLTRLFYERQRRQ